MSGWHCQAACHRALHAQGARGQGEAPPSTPRPPSCTSQGTPQVLGPGRHPPTLPPPHSCTPAPISPPRVHPKGAAGAARQPRGRGYGEDATPCLPFRPPPNLHPSPPKVHPRRAAGAARQLVVGPRMPRGRGGGGSCQEVGRQQTHALGVNGVVGGAATADAAAAE